MYRIHALALVPLLIVLAGSARAEDSPVEDPVLAAIDAEVARAMEQLGTLGEDAPYFISVEVAQTEGVSISGEDGALHSYSPWIRRSVDVDVRIGSPQLDSSHALRKERSMDRFSDAGGSLPIEGDPAVLQRALWTSIDQRYRQARERWAKVRAEAKTLVDEEPAEDLAATDPVVDLGPIGVLSFPAEVWEESARVASAELARSGAILDASVNLGGGITTRWFVSSEGTRLRHTESRFRAGLTASARADDGDDLRLFRGFESATAAGLPSGGELTEHSRSLVGEVDAILAAPREEPYNGPAILSDRAAGVFFHEVFGHRVEGHRLKQVTDAQTFRRRVGEQILPPFLSVFDDPTLAHAGGRDLRGHYRYDNQGVPAGRVVLVEDGILRSFLQSRSPVEDGQVSNGHGRRQAGKDAVSRQGNLQIVAAETVTDAQLREKLVAAVKEEGLPFGLYIEEIAGGFTFTGRSIPNAFNVNAVKAWRVFADGRPDELVRGVDLIGTPLDAFSNIVAAGESKDVFNGNCGAESGWVPVSAVAPSLLLRRVETQRKRQGQETAPLLPPPLPDEGGAS